jgi:diaminohydroxyphosphoribosylaminopyrimidine deaminase/5-amino-6-(5-phosphoribosylamino)uracil reductase
VTGVDAPAVARENAPFLTWMSHGRPFVTSKVAVSADGFVGRIGGPVRLTGAASDRRTHRERGAVEALLVGAGTVLADDPELTARLAYRTRPLLRVVLDRRGRTPATARLFGTLAHGPVAMVTTPETAAGSAAREWSRAGADVLAVEPGSTLSDAPDDGAWLRRVLAVLAAREVLHVIVEGGPTVHRAFWAHGLVDRVRIIETPHMLGDGVPVFRPPAPALAARVRAVGPDRWVEWDVHGID